MSGLRAKAPYDGPPRPGERIALRFRVERVLGSGGMGHVVSARDEWGRSFAIKLLRPTPSFLSGRHVRPGTEGVWQKRFDREGAILARVRSPHLVRVHESSGPRAPTPYLVMDRLVGLDLAKTLERRGRLPLTAVADVVVQVCAALAPLHAAGIVHRDLKPANLFDHVDPNGSRILKVLDLGIAKLGANDDDHEGHPAPDLLALASERPSDLTSSRDGMLGTPAYMSPEHIRDPRRVDHRSDLWALGVVAYQLATGTLPFDGRGVGELFLAAIRSDFVRLEGTADVPPELGRAIDSCLAADPMARPQTAADLARSVRAFASPAIAALADAVPGVRTIPAALPASCATPSGALTTRIDGRASTLTVPAGLTGGGERSVRESGIFGAEGDERAALVR
jgi:eukaryotic-like serine/threonine-protein kinase